VAQVMTPLTVGLAAMPYMVGVATIPLTLLLNLVHSPILLTVALEQIL